MRQLRIQAKELLSAAQSGDPTALSSLEPKGAKIKLSDAQSAIALKYGYKSWAALLDDLETPDLIRQMVSMVEICDAPALDKLLKANPRLRKHLNDELGVFNSTLMIDASRRPGANRIVPILAKYGADPNRRSGWWAGGFSALDFADPSTTQLLLELGAVFDVWSAAAQGRDDILVEILERDPNLINARGGDGETPLHFAANANTAKILIERGADLEIRDIDHESSPIQYQSHHPEVMRLLVESGAKPDVFTAAVLDDVELLNKVLKEDPNAKMARVGKAPFVTVQSDGGHIYTYKFGPRKTPQIVAAERGAWNVFKALVEGVLPVRRLTAAAWIEDVPAFEEALKEMNNAGMRPEGEDGSSLAEAALKGRIGAVELLLRAGFDPNAPGMDSGTSLHVAAWAGNLSIVNLLIDKVPLETRDAHHGGTPLGWALHGAHHSRIPGSDHIGVVKALIAAGAAVDQFKASGQTPGMSREIWDLIRTA